MEPFRPIDLEKGILGYWDKIDLFNAIQRKNRDGKKFYYLDGPPYVNGNPHMGHARTRAIRDPLLKYRVMRGDNVRLQPGFDCHGLPIEIKVEEELGFRTKEEIEAFGPERFIEKCRERALFYIDVFKGFYKRFGLHWDLENPYLTLQNEYISSAWSFFKRCEEKKLLYRGRATTAWCPRCQTALAGYEATDEYRDVSDYSIYVKFPLVGKKDEFIIVWTTTPWTLPANLAVTINPKYEYVKVKVGDERWLLAKELVPTVLKDCGIEGYKIEGKGIRGKELEGLKYEFVLGDIVPANPGLKAEKLHTVLAGDFVTLEDGTGVVHTAPGHGQEDYSVGVKYGLPPFSPVGENGRYTEEGGRLKGMFVKDADEIIIDELRHKGYLIGEKKIVHRYAHCWRCKTPIIYRASPQWFINIERVKGLMMEENRKVKWIPDWAGEKRFQNWIEEARDWCISRQRYWGIPLPIWQCECGKYEVIGGWEELKGKAVKLPKGEPDLHVPYTNKIKIRCKCGKEMSRVPDITDIWFESGAATFASLNYPRSDLLKKLFPADFITEGLDQTRGWFYTLMTEGIIMFGQAPYKTVLMNEWVLDKNGEKMSKSVGNVINPKDMIEKYGADITRFYLLEETQVWEKLKFDPENMRIVHRLLNTLWNSYQFAKTYMCADGFDPKKSGVPDYGKYLELEDKWMLSRLETVKGDVTKNLEGYLPYECVVELDDFIMNDLSRWYIKLIRDRTWVSASGRGKEAAYAVLYKVLVDLSKLMAPFTPFIAEYIFRDLTGEESVFLSGWVEAGGKPDKKLEGKMKLAKEVVEAANAARDEAGIKLRWPVGEIVIVCREDLKGLEGVIANMVNSKGVRFGDKKPKGMVEKEFSSGSVFLSKERPMELIEEGWMRDLMRQIQNMRKKEGLDVSETVALKVYAPEKIAPVIKRFEDEILKNTTSKGMAIGKGKPKVFKSYFKIDDCEFWLDYEK
jgi:isoleucyl-tRNA synthetase